MRILNLNNIIAYFKLHSRAYFRSKGSIFFQLAFPIILMIIFGAIFGGSSTAPTQLVIQNESPSQISWEIVNAINDTGIFKVKILNENSSINSYISDNSVSAALLIPKNFTQNFAMNGSASLIFTGIGNPQEEQQEYQILNNVVTSMNYKIEGKNPSLVLKSDYISQQSLKEVDFYVPGLIGFTILNSMFAMIYQVPNYRKDRIFRQLSFSGISKGEWVISTALFNFLLTVLSDAILVIIAYTLFGASLNFTILTSLVTLVILFSGMLLFIGIGILAGMVSDNEETVSVIGNLIIFPMMFLSGVFFPLAFAPSYVKTISDFLPLTYFINSLNDMLIYKNYSVLELEVPILIVFSIAIFLISVKLFKWNE